MKEPAQIIALRRRAFALAGQLAGPGPAAYDLLHDLFHRYTGLTTLAGLTVEQWLALINELRAQQAARSRPPGSCTPRQWAYIQDLRRQQGMTDDHWRNFLKKQLRIDHERFLTPAKARGVITALLKMRARTVPASPVGDAREAAG